MSPGTEMRWRGSFGCMIVLQYITYTCAGIYDWWCCLFSFMYSTLPWHLPSASYTFLDIPPSCFHINKYYISASGYHPFHAMTHRRMVFGLHGYYIAVWPNTEFIVTLSSPKFCISLPLDPFYEIHLTGVGRFCYPGIVWFDVPFTNPSNVCIVVYVVIGQCVVNLISFLFSHFSDSCS